MDSLTQAVLGAGIQGALLGRYQGRKALLYGALLGSLPDMDVLISYADPIDVMTRHRGFSHSLLVLTGLSAVLAVAWQRWRKPAYSVWRLFLALWLVLATHPLLDAFTSYGTQLAWPWTPIPVSWSSIFIIDPFFTVPLLLAVLAYAWRGPGSPPPAWGMATVAVPGDSHARWLWACLIWCVIYLGAGQIGRQAADRHALAQLPAQHAATSQVFSTPLPLNILGWRSVIRDGNTLREYTFSLLDGERLPESVTYPAGSEYLETASQHPSFRRLEWFSGGWLRLLEEDNALIAEDLRMGLAQRATFRFAIACKNDSGNWTLIAPVKLSHGDDRLAAIGAGLRRSFDPEATLPLEDWAAGSLARTPPSPPVADVCPGQPL